MTWRSSIMLLSGCAGLACALLLGWVHGPVRLGATPASATKELPEAAVAREVPARSPAPAHMAAQRPGAQGKGTARREAASGPAASGGVVDGAGRFHADRVTPYLDQGSAARARERLEIDDHDGALPLLRRALKEAGARERPRVSFVLAWLLSQMGRHAEAAGRFDSLRRAYPMLAHHSAYLGARSLYHLGRAAEALAMLATLPKEGPLAPRALLMRGDALRSLGRWPEARAAYDAFLRRYGARAGAIEARLRLAEALLHLSAERRRAVDLLKQVRSLAPASAWDRLSGPLWRRALAGLQDRALRARLAAPTCAEGLQRLLSLTHRNRLSEALRELPRWRRRGCKAAHVCVVTATLGRRLALNRRLRARALAPLSDAVRTCRGGALGIHRAKALYAAARIHAAQGRTQAALRRYGQIEREHPKHSYADDARYRAAALKRKLGQDARADRMLRTLPDRYPKGDMQHQALWQLTWGAYQKGDSRRALALLTRSAALTAPVPRVEQAGRDHYWRARLLQDDGRRREALRAYEGVLRRYPFTYYALLAANRLREQSPERLRLILREQTRSPSRATFSFGPDPLFLKPGFARAVELARLGLGRLALEELQGLGLRSPAAPVGASRGPRTLDGGAPGSRGKLTSRQSERLWAAAHLFYRAGLHHRSHWLVRRVLPAHASKPPRGAHRLRWRIGHPRAYSSLVLPASRREGLSPELVWGLMREESAFEPTLVSHAGAVGLMQLLPTTARRFTRRGEARVSRVALKRPLKNIPVGTRYLAWLKRLFQGNLVLAVAAYNAGETRVFSWVRERGDQPIDRFVEEIPFRETRHYVKRVLGSAFAYRALTDSPMMDLPAVFPPKLIVAAKRWKIEVTRWIRARGRRGKRRGRRPRPRVARPRRP